MLASYRRPLSNARGVCLLPSLGANHSSLQEMLAYSSSGFNGSLYSLMLHCCHLLEVVNSYSAQCQMFLIQSILIRKLTKHVLPSTTPQYVLYSCSSFPKSFHFFHNVLSLVGYIFIVVSGSQSHELAFVLSAHIE